MKGIRCGFLAAMVLTVSFCMASCGGQGMAATGIIETNGSETTIVESSYWEQEKEMILIETGKESFCFYQDEESLLWGIYDSSRNEIVLNAVYEEIGNFGDSDFAPVKKDGHWGYIDYLGNVVIDFYFDKADDFVRNYASVYCKGSGRGVIDVAGAYIVEPQYASVDIYENYIVGWFSHGFCEVYNYAGKKIASESVEGYPFAKVHFENGFVYAGIKGSDKYEVYDSEGVRWNGVRWGEEKDLSDVLYISLPVNGVHVLYCAEKESYLNYYRDIGMRLADEWFNLLNNKLYTDVSDFNELGLAVVEEDYGAWFILKKDGSVLKELPTHKIYDLEVNYTYANDYFACCRVSVGMTGGTYYGVVDLETDKLIRWGEVTPVDGTNCLIVLDEDTGLKGLYDENKLVLECVYQDIKYEKGVFYCTRGAVEDQYIPIEQEKIVQVMKEAQAYADKGDYISAIKHLKSSGIRVMTDDVIAKMEEYIGSHNKKILAEVEKYWDEEKYVEAITTLKNEALLDYDKNLSIRLTEYREKYCTILFETAQRLAQNGDYGQAISCLQEGSSYVLHRDVAEIEKQIDEYKRKQAE